MPPWSHRALLGALRALPTHALSRAAGRVVSTRLPGPAQRWQIRAFARAVGADLSEVRDPIESFRCLQDFFTRALAADARPIDPDRDAIVAPCDGAWGAAGTVERGTLLQVKGRPYSLAALLGNETAAAPFDGGRYATFYLSPRDYHRFHAPCAVTVVHATYLPGTLWPVNRIGIDGVDGLFAQNERICAFMSVRGAAVDLCLVAVGATLVGKVRVTFDDLTTNVRGAAPVERHYGDNGPRLAKGEEWGRFEFGSTIVMIAAPGLLTLDLQAPGSPLRLGQHIGSLQPAHDRD
jgi:phosphatidylserine decarboxylase